MFLIESRVHGWIINFKARTLDNLLLTKNLMLDFNFIIVEEDQSRLVLNLMFNVLMACVLGIK